MEDEETASAWPLWWSTPERMRPDLSSLPPASPPSPSPSLTQLLLDTDLKPWSDWSQGGQVVQAGPWLSCPGAGGPAAFFSGKPCRQGQLQPFWATQLLAFL